MGWKVTLEEVFKEDHPNVEQIGEEWEGVSQAKHTRNSIQDKGNSTWDREQHLSSVCLSSQKKTGAIEEQWTKQESEIRYRDRQGSRQKDL